MCGIENDGFYFISKMFPFVYLTDPLHDLLALVFILGVVDCVILGGTTLLNSCPTKNVIMIISYILCLKNCYKLKNCPQYIIVNSNKIFSWFTIPFPKTAKCCNPTGP